MQGSECIYAAEKDAKRIVRLALGEFPSKDEASNAYTMARAKAQFDGLMVENVRGVGQRAHWLPQTNNFERTVLGEQVEFGELTVLKGRRVYSVFSRATVEGEGTRSHEARHRRLAVAVPAAARGEQADHVTGGKLQVHLSGRRRAAVCRPRGAASSPPATRLPAVYAPGPAGTPLGDE